MLFFNNICAIFSNSRHSIRVNNCCIVSFDVIRPMGGICDKQVFTEFLTILPNCFTGANAAVDEYVNSSIYILVFMTFFMLYVRLVHSWAFESSSIKEVLKALISPILCFCGCLF